MEGIGRRETSYYGSVGGNYDGTYIEWFIVEDEQSRPLYSCIINYKINYEKLTMTDQLKSYLQNHRNIIEEQELR